MRTVDVISSSTEIDKITRYVNVQETNLEIVFVELSLLLQMDFHLEDT